MREFLMLAQTFDPSNCKFIPGWYVSEKLDGMRAFWDGGITRGMLTANVPFANNDRKDHLIKSPVATGLWSRYGNVIYAPDWFLDQLPEFCLDGELWIDRGKFQDLVSIVKKHEPVEEWHSVKYIIFDGPSYRDVFSNGHINGTNFKKSFIDVLPWTAARAKCPVTMIHNSQFFDKRYQLLQALIENNENLMIMEQSVLPLNFNEAYKTLERLRKLTKELGGEGLIIRNPTSFWVPKRAHTMLKVKSNQDNEGKVIGYYWGEATDKGSKLLGLMGSVILEFQGKQFSLSGFKDEERTMTFVKNGDPAFVIGIKAPGKVVNSDIHNPKFPRGSLVTFEYRELTKDGLPKEARFLRERSEE